MTLNNKKVVTILTSIQLITIFISGIIYNIITTPFKLSFYEDFYKKNSLANELNISHQDLISYTKNLLAYLKTNTPLDDSWFSKKDIAHMIDVQNLYSTSYNILTILITLAIITTIINIIIGKKIILEVINKIFFKVLAIFLIIIFALSAFVFTNFNKFWIKFHEILFTNDLWLLSPDESNLIKMFPEQFFFLLVKAILVKIAIFFFILFAIKLYINFHLKFFGKNKKSI